MDSQDKSIAIVLSSFCAVIAVLIISIALFYSSKHAKIAEMVKSGADPMLVSCAVDESYSNVCEMYFLNKNIYDLHSLDKK